MNQRIHKPGCKANMECLVDHGGRPCPGPYGTCTCDTPQETPPSGEKKADLAQALDTLDHSLDRVIDNLTSPSPLADTVGGGECEHEWGNYDDGEGGNSWFECRKCTTQRDTPPKAMDKTQPTPERLRCECGHSYSVHSRGKILGAYCPMPNCVCQKYTPQIPPVNSRADTGPRGEEVWTPSPCDPANLVPSPLADTVGGEGTREALRLAKEVAASCEKQPSPLGALAQIMKHPIEVKDVAVPTLPSKQSEECYVDSRTPEEKANEPSATVTSAGGPMTVALTPPKAEGVGESYLLPGGGLVENFPPIPLKEERIANDEKIRAYLNSITKGVTVTVEVGQLEHFLFKFIDERDFLFLQHLTSATREAEKRKDLEWKKDIALVVEREDDKDEYYEGRCAACERMPMLVRKSNVGLLSCGAPQKEYSICFLCQFRSIGDLPFNKPGSVRGFLVPPPPSKPTQP